MNVSFYAKKHEVIRNKTSHLIHRERTNKSRGLSHAHDSNHKKFQGITERLGDISRMLKDQDKTSWVKTPHDLRKELSLRHGLLAEMREKRGQACSIMKRNRTLKNAWAAGIVGVEQPGDDPSSELYGQTFKHFSALERSHDRLHKNRLQSKYLLNLKRFTQTGN